MKKLVCFMFAFGCGVDAEDGVSGRVDSIRYETVHAGDQIAARFTTLDGDPIVTVAAEDAMPGGWDAGGRTLDAASYRDAITSALSALAGDLAPADHAALEAAAAALQDGKDVQHALQTRTWYASCVPTSNGSEYARISFINGGGVTETVKLTRVYAVRSGSIYSLYSSHTLVPNGSTSVRLEVSNGANVLRFTWSADPLTYIYHDTSNYCW